MIPELGHYALVLALFAAGIQAILGLLGARRKDAYWLLATGPAASTQFLFVAIAFLALMHAFVVSDFSVYTVAKYSHSAKPLLYKLTGVWGNHEGSMLLWVMILAIFSQALVSFGKDLPHTLRARVLGIQGCLSTGFLLFILFTSNPFLRLDPAPRDGQGLNPLLQDPGLAFHPPFLYLGYVGLSMAFAFAIAGLLEGRIDAAWARRVRPWVLVAWSFLTIGIALGSWWAYYELGWGGFWFWDPVENASLLPWLAGTALLHSLSVVEKRESLKSWVVLLAILAFSLSLIGTFLVRSGVLVSVHAFATDPTRGVFILALLTLAIGGSLALFALRAPKLKPVGSFEPLSREGGLLLNNLFLVTAAASVFLGTLYPLILEAVSDEKVSVGPPFFNATVLPLLLPLVFAMGIGPYLSWKRADFFAVTRRLWTAALAALLIAGATAALYSGKSPLALLGIGLAVWLFASNGLLLAERMKLFRLPFSESFARLRAIPASFFGMFVAHMGIAVLLAGITASTLWQTEEIRAMRPGEEVMLAGYEIRFESAKRLPGPNYIADRGTFRIAREGTLITRLAPERRYYPVEKQWTTEAAIHTTWLSDIYVVLGERPKGEGPWAVRLYHNPLVPWIWIGAILAALGGGLSLADRRHRRHGTRKAEKQ
ncbi:MAG: heme lyase CcmF/NrfE family subunit [Alphaproteobacteria bacterium]